MYYYPLPLAMKHEPSVSSTISLREANHQFLSLSTEAHLHYRNTYKFDKNSLIQNTFLSNCLRHPLNSTKLYLVTQSPQPYTKKAKYDYLE